MFNEHQPTISVAQELSINPKTLHSRVKQYCEGSLAPLDKTDSATPEQAENARLRAEPQKAQAEILLKTIRDVPFKEWALRCAYIKGSLQDHELKGIPTVLRCQILSVSVSGYLSCMGQTLGYRQMHMLMRRRGIKVGTKRLRQVLRFNGIIGNLFLSVQ